MNFKTPRIQSEWDRQEPELRDVLLELDAHLMFWGLPNITVTELHRTKEEAFKLYFAEGRAKGLSAQNAKWRAQRRFTYHFCDCAADFRSSGKPWTKAETDRVFAWLRKRCPVGAWGLLFHDAGTGPHFHLELKSKERRDAWEQAQRGTV